jgi:hypothetical protein
MPPIYLTPTRYRSLGLGVDLSSRTDTELASILNIAAGLVNSYCSVPTNHDFRGGTVTLEQHVWDWGTTQTPLPLRVYPDHTPIRSVSELRIDVTNTQFISYTDPDQLYIHTDKGFVEPISLAASTVGMFGTYVLPSVGLRLPVAKLSYVYGWVFSAIDEELTTYSSSAGIVQGQNQFWLDDPTVIVKKNGVTLTAGAQYTLDAFEGQVTVSSFDPTAIYSATYDYPLPGSIALATALVGTDVLGQTNINASGLLGLSGLRVEEVELRQSARTGFTVNAVSMAAKTLLAPYVYHNWG